ncbi:hypothetical protein ACE4Z5_26555, partial [Salmonella enterica]|uniref:hypothetical protein n=1 Tax=Salmonella enterica TaxID=28901 RepID=UPI003D2A2EF4
IQAVGAVIDDILTNPGAYYSESLDDSFLPSSAAKQRVRSPKIKNYWTDTSWGRLVTSLRENFDEDSRDARRFRRRFRVPFPVFEDLV